VFGVATTMALLLEPAEEGTRVTMDAHVRGEGPSRLPAPIVTRGNAQAPPSPPSLICDAFSVTRAETAELGSRTRGLRAKERRAAVRVLAARANCPFAATGLPTQ
jgi:hypothetical protein